MKIYFVKSLYRRAASGPASNVDRHHDPAFTLVEERIVMVGARTAVEALKKAEREARAYASDEHLNAYGQVVSTRFLGALESYEPFDPIAPGVEVFSSTEAVPASVPDTTIVDRRMGHAETVVEARRRINVGHGEFYEFKEVEGRPARPAPSREADRPRGGRRPRSGASESGRSGRGSRG